MERYEYMKMSLDTIPNKIIAQYQIRFLASDGWRKSKKSCLG